MIHYSPLVYLDVIRQEHLPIYHAWRNDPLIHRWTRQSDLISWDSHWSWHYELSKRPDVKFYAIHSPSIDYPEDHPVGMTGFSSIDSLNRRAEFSLYIGPEYQKKGYGREALKSLLQHGFYALGLNCIWGETFDQNPAMGLFVSLGMKKEGTRRQFYYRNGKFIDAHLVSILREEWDSGVGKTLQWNELCVGSHT